MGLILLDRDGVLNRVIVDPEHGTIDSPLHPSQVEIFPWVPDALHRLNQAGYGLVIVTNQPAFAKGKTILDNLDATHNRVIELIETQGAKILKSYLCFHRAEDHCGCRKPKPAMLKQALVDYPQYTRESSWMVGDGVTDMEAGKACDLKTAFLAAKKCDARQILADLNLQPDFWGANLLEFTNYLLNSDRT